jgi:uncharacterized membrane protein
MNTDIDKKEVKIKSDDKVILQQSYVQEINGALPSASEIELYNKTNPDIIKFLIRDAEIIRDETIKTNTKQIELIERKQNREYKLNVIGIILGAFVSLIIIGCAVYLSRIGDHITAGILAGTNISLIILAFTKR